MNVTFYYSTAEPHSSTNAASQANILVRRKHRKVPNKLLPPSNIFKIIALCLWDNVSGPRTEQVWEIEQTQQEQLSYICRYTLGGEISNSEKDDSDSSTLLSKFHILPQYSKKKTKKKLTKNNFFLIYYQSRLYC